MPERKPRLFIGVAIDDAARAACSSLATRLEACAPNVRFVEPENYHLTVVFLGNVDVERILVVESSIAAVAARHTRCSVTFERLGAFAHERKPRVIFVGSRGVEAAYRALASDMRNACALLGYPSEKDAIPHLTLARVPEHRRVALPMLDVESFSIPITALTLFESISHEGRTRYVVRHSEALTAVSGV